MTTTDPWGLDGLEQFVKNQKRAMEPQYELDESFWDDVEAGNVEMPDDEDEEDDSGPETKGIRHVRTPEGARQYGQPIGSVIKPDAVPAGRLEARPDSFWFGGSKAEWRERLKQKWPRKGKKDPLAKKKVSGNFWDSYEGIRNWDFEVEGEEVDWDDDRSRARNARKEAEELGIEVTGNGAIDYVETSLAAMRTYQETFPGIGYYLDRVSFSNLGRGVNGENRIHYKTGEDGKTYTGNTIHMSSTKFGHYTDDADVEARAREVDSTNYYSTENSDAVAVSGQESWRCDFLRTFNHEIGHTMARVAMGHLKGENETEEQREARRDYTYEQVKNIFGKYGMKFEPFSKDDSLGFFGNQDQGMRLFIPTAAWTEDESLKEVLSAYGTTNVHEMFAEAWAEYMTASEPRAFARDLGELMEDMMNEFLDQDGAR